MKSTAAAALAVAVTAVAAGCASGGSTGASGSTSPAPTSAGPVVSSSAPATVPSTAAPTTPAAVAGSACQKVVATLQKSQTQLAQAGQSGSKQKLDSAVSKLVDQLNAEAKHGSTRLQSAVRTYAGDLEQIVTQAEKGKQPNLSQVVTDARAIGEACTSSG